MRSFNIIVDLSHYRDIIKNDSDLRMLPLGGSGGQMVSLAYEMMSVKDDVSLYVYIGSSSNLAHTNSQIRLFTEKSMPWEILKSPEAINIIRFDSFYKKLLN